MNVFKNLLEEGIRIEKNIIFKLFTKINENLKNKTLFKLPIYKQFAQQIDICLCLNVMEKFNILKKEFENLYYFTKFLNNQI